MKASRRRMCSVLLPSIPESTGGREVGGEIHREGGRDRPERPSTLDTVCRFLALVS